MKRFLALGLLLVFAGLAQEAYCAPTEKAMFAGGCFWCMQADFASRPGVVSTTVGYTGGYTANPNYESVAQGNTGHMEAVQVVYDPEQISYEKLLEIFWDNIDPTDRDGQFSDRGTQYHTAIFTYTGEQNALAATSKKVIERKLNKASYTAILGAGTFYPAEDEHQNYYQKNPAAYDAYKRGSGRDAKLNELWNK